MRQAPRRRVIRYELRYTPLLRRQTRYAVLECGHAINVGVSTSNSKRMACWDCEDERARAAG